MTNLLNESRFIILSRKFSGVFKSLIVTFTLFFIFLIWLFFSYLPNDLKINTQQGLQQNYFQQKVAYQKMINQFNSLEKENVVLVQNLEKYNFNFDILKRNIDFVLNSLDKNELKCSEFKPVENKQNEFFDKEYYLLKANGSYTRAMSFFSNLEKSGRGIKFKDIQLVKNEHDKVFVVAKLRLINCLSL